MSIPTEFKGDLHFFYEVRGGWIAVVQSERMPDEYIPLGTLENVCIKFDREAGTKAAVEKLQASIKDVQANAQQEVNYLEEQIQSMLALNYEEDML